MSIKKFIPYKVVILRRKMLAEWRVFRRTNMIVKNEIPILHLHLADHCNLNCKGCDNFSPIADEVFTDLDVFDADCARVAELSNAKIALVQLLGGEPLLHPQVIDFLRLARHHFPTNRIELVSNGILLKKQKDIFWESCRNYNINIIVTKYPINIDFSDVKMKAQQMNVSFAFYGNTEEVDKTMMCIPIDVEGKQNAEDSFLRCSRANRCVAVDNGNIYPCSLIPYIKYFNKQFNQNLQIGDKDFLPLNKAKSLDEILNFISNPVPFCRFCDIKSTVWDIGYGRSTKSLSEWTLSKK